MHNSSKNPLAFPTIFRFPAFEILDIMIIILIHFYTHLHGKFLDFPLQSHIIEAIRKMLLFVSNNVGF